MVINVNRRRKQDLGLARIAVADDHQPAWRNAFGLVEIALDLCVGQSHGDHGLDCIEPLLAPALSGDLRMIR